MFETFTKCILMQKCKDEKQTYVIIHGYFSLVFVFVGQFSLVNSMSCPKKKISIKNLIVRLSILLFLLSFVAKHEQTGSPVFHSFNENVIWIRINICVHLCCDVSVFCV